MDIDLGILEDFKVEDKEWIDWGFKHEEYENIPLTFFSRFGKGQLKCCDLSTAVARKDQEDFFLIEGNTKVTNKGFISMNIKMGDRRKNTMASTRTFTKKQRRGLRTWHNQYKTKFKEITVKNDWTNVKTINKRDLSENIPKVSKPKIETLKVKGHLHKLNQKVERINWTPLGFKENEEYKLKTVKTLQDPEFEEIATKLLSSEEPIKKSVVCSPQFLLAIMTVRGGQYPWAIHVQKEGNVLLFENYRAGDEHNNDLTYLDLFTTSENTTSNMPSDQGKVKDYCVNATKYTKIFKDLLASGDLYDQEVIEEEEEKEEEQGEEEGEEKEEDLDYKKKYVKIQLEDIDIYTSVSIDGVKIKSDSTAEECLIRTFVETGTDGAWIQDIRKAQGTLVFQEYLANSCSLQKWIIEGRIAGVDMIKIGFVGFERQKPKLINVNETTLKTLESSISFKEADSWPILKYILDVLYSCESGTYILSRSPYNPLALKLFNLPPKEEEEEDEEDS